MVTMEFVLIISGLLYSKFYADFGELWCYFCLFLFALFECLPWLPSQLSITSVLVEYHLKKLSPNANPK